MVQLTHPGGRLCQIDLAYLFLLDFEKRWILFFSAQSSVYEFLAGIYLRFVPFLVRDYGLVTLLVHDPC